MQFQKPETRFVFNLFTNTYLNQIINVFKNIGILAYGYLENIIKMIKKGRKMDRREKISEALKAVYKTALLATEIKRIERNLKDAQKIAAGLVKLYIDEELPLGFYFAFGELRPYGVTDILVTSIYSKTIKIKEEEEEDKNDITKKTGIKIFNVETEDIKLSKRIKEPVLEPDDEQDITKKTEKVIQKNIQKPVVKSFKDQIKEKAKTYAEKKFLKKAKVDAAREIIAYIWSLKNAKPLGWGSKTKFYNMKRSTEVIKDMYVGLGGIFERNIWYSNNEAQFTAPLRFGNIFDVTETEGKRFLRRTIVKQTPYTFFYQNGLGTTIDDKAFSLFAEEIKNIQQKIEDEEGMEKIVKDYYEKYYFGVHEAEIGRMLESFIKEYQVFYKEDVFIPISKPSIIYETALIMKQEVYRDVNIEGSEEEKENVFKDTKKKYFINFIYDKPPEPLINDNKNKDLSKHIEISSELLQRLFYRINKYEAEDLTFLSKLYEAEAFLPDAKGITLVKLQKDNSPKNKDDSSKNSDANNKDYSFENSDANNIRYIIDGLAELYLQSIKSTYSYLSSSELNMPNFCLVSLEPFSRFFDDLPSVYPINITVPIYEDNIYKVDKKTLFIYKDILPIRSLTINRKDVKTDTLTLPGDFSFEIPSGWDPFGFTSIDLEIYETSERVLTKYFREYYRRAFFRGVARPVFDIAFILDVIILDNQFRVDDILSLIVVPNSIPGLFDVNFEMDEHLKEPQPFKISFSAIGFISYISIFSSTQQEGSRFGVDYATGAVSIPYLRDLDKETLTQIKAATYRPNFYLDFLAGRISEDLAKKLQTISDVLLLNWYATKTTNPWTGEYYLKLPQETQENQLTKELYMKYVEKIKNQNIPSSRDYRTYRPINITAGPFAKKYAIVKETSQKR